MEDWRSLKRAMKALAGVARLTIVYHLARQSSVTVTELTTRLSISQPLVSWHLRTLRRAGLIEMQRNGRQVHCSLNKERFQQCLSQLQTLIDPNGYPGPHPVGPALIEADVISDE